jgi:hypothetical protein
MEEAAARRPFLCGDAWLSKIVLFYSDLGSNEGWSWLPQASIAGSALFWRTRVAEITGEKKFSLFFRYLDGVNGIIFCLNCALWLNILDFGLPFG